MENGPSQMEFQRLGRGPANSFTYWPCVQLLIAGAGRGGGPGEVCPYLAGCRCEVPVR